MVAGDDQQRRQAGSGRGLGGRTADRVSRRSPTARGRRARRRPAARGCSARAAYQPPWVAASKASKGRSPEPGVRWSTAACTPPHGSSGVTGASLPRASATPASARSANGLVASGPRGAEPLGVHAGVPAPGGVEGRLHAGDHPPVAHPVDRRRRRPSPRAPAGAGRPARRRPAELGDHGVDGVEHLVDGGVADARGSRPGCRRRCRRGRGRPAAPVSKRRCPAVSRPVGVGRAAQRARCASRRRRRRTGLRRRRPGPARGRRRGRRARPARPSSRAPAGRAARRRASSRPARSSAPETSGPAISCRLPMPRAAAASQGGALGGPPLVGADRAEGGLPGGVVGVEPQPAVGGEAGQVGDARDARRAGRSRRWPSGRRPGPGRPAGRRRRRPGRAGSGPRRSGQAVSSQPVPSTMPAARRRRAPGDGRDGLGEARARVEVQTGEREPGRGGVHVGVDEGRGEQRPLPRDRCGRRPARRRPAPSQAIRPSTTCTARPGRSPTVTSVTQQAHAVARRGSIRARTPGSAR